MKTLSIDLETFSDVDLQECGVYKYAESPNFEILLFGYSSNGGAVRVVDLINGEEIPPEIIGALTDESVTKWAYNASFERLCLSRFLGLPHGEFLSPDAWKCSQVWAAYLGLPSALKDVGEALKLDRQKMSEGAELIKYFCVPCRPTKANGGRARNMPQDSPNDWRVFKSYNKRDVEAEMEIQSRLSGFPVPDFVWEEYHLDQRINDRGIALDMGFVRNAIALDEQTRKELTGKMRELTELENPNSVVQMKQWLAKNGLGIETLGKKDVAKLLETAPPKLAEVLKLRQRLAKSSVKKYAAMESVVCADSRARGMFKFYGANRSGRWTGRSIQPQNLPQNHMPDLAQARGLVKTGNFGALEILYDDIPDTLSQLIRTALVPREGQKFIVADFSAIEARVLAWLAGEDWRSEAFKSGGDIYCASASQMFGVPVEKHGINGHLRQKGKIAELALGYGGGVGALKSTGALEMGLTEEELRPLVDSWRDANPNIVRFWWDADREIKNCVKYKNPTQTHGIKFTCQSGILFIELPSGRRLSYVKPKIGYNQFGGESVTYMGIGGTKKWERIESYGPKFVENITQAISRDILCYAMRNLSQKWDIVAHVHDEVIIECEKDADLSEVCRVMGKTPPWANGLILRADGYECEFYRKD